MRPRCPQHHTSTPKTANHHTPPTQKGVGGVAGPPPPPPPQPALKPHRARQDGLVAVLSAREHNRPSEQDPLKARAEHRAEGA